MKIGKVIGLVRMKRETESLRGQTFLLVDTGREDVVAADRTGAGVGDRVLLAMGTAAARYCMDVPVDAAVVAVIDAEPADVSR